MKAQKKESRKNKQKKKKKKEKRMKRRKKRVQSRCGSRSDRWTAKNHRVSWSAWQVRRYARSAWDSQGMNR